MFDSAVVGPMDWERDSMGDSMTNVVSDGFATDVVVAIVLVGVDDAEVTVNVCGVECSVAIRGCLIDTAGSD